MRRLLAVATLVGLAASVSGQSRRAPVRTVKPGIAIGDLVWTDGEVQRAEPPNKTSWRAVTSGASLRTGDTLRTSETAVARIEFPWMKLALAPSTMITIPPTTVLSTVLDQGRAEFSGPGRDIVKIQVGEGEVRGGGRLVLRRSAGRTSATALAGAFRVRAMGRTVEIRKGEGTLVVDGRPPEPPRALPEAPTALRPGDEVGYVRSGQLAELRWSGSGQAHVELLALELRDQEDAVLLSRDVAASPLLVSVPWLGTYRWRVSTRDARGIESVPSPDGLICSVER